MLARSRSFTTIAYTSARGSCPNRRELVIRSRLGVRWQLDHSERPSSRIAGQQQRQRNVVSGHTLARPTLGGSVVGMAMEDSADLHAVDGILEPARSQERVDLLRLSTDGRRDRRVVQQCDPRSRSEPGQTRLELHGLVDRRLDEGLGGHLAPGAERMDVESACETLGPCKSDARQLDGIAVEHLHTRLAQDLRDLDLLAGLMVMVTQHTY